MVEARTDWSSQVQVGAAKDMFGQQRAVKNRLGQSWTGWGSKGQVGAVNNKLELAKGRWVVQPSTGCSSLERVRAAKVILGPPGTGWASLGSP